MSDLSNFAKESEDLYPKDELTLSFKAAGKNSKNRIFLNFAIMFLLSVYFLYLILSGYDYERNISTIFVSFFGVLAFGYHSISIFYNTIEIIINKNEIRLFHKKLPFTMDTRNVDIQNVVYVEVVPRMHERLQTNVYYVDCTTAQDSTYWLHYFEEEERAVELANTIRNFYGIKD